MKHDDLINAFLVCNTPEMLQEFLIDLLTAVERAEFSQRLDIAKRLYNKESYKHIEQMTGASSTTIARVARFLHRPNSGYKQILTQTINTI